MEVKVKKTINVNNIKQLVLTILAGLGILWTILIATQLYVEQKNNNEYINLVKNGNEKDRFERAICMVPGTYVSKPFDPGNGVKFVEIWDYNNRTGEVVHYFRPIGET